MSAGRRGLPGTCRWLRVAGCTGSGRAGPQRPPVPTRWRRPRSPLRCCRRCCWAQTAGCHPGRLAGHCRAGQRGAPSRIAPALGLAGRLLCRFPCWLQQVCCSPGNQEAAGPRLCANNAGIRVAPCFWRRKNRKKAPPAFKGGRANGEPANHPPFCTQPLGPGGGTRGRHAPHAPHVQCTLRLAVH